jgi:hypothetical protein
MATTICCDVSMSVGRRHELVICDEHRSKGWGIYRNSRGFEILDRAETAECGCIRTTIEQLSLSTCVRHAIGPHACCERATATPCVCVYSYACPEHGDIHIGSHE